METPSKLPAIVKVNLQQANAIFQEYTHEPVLNYETAAKVSARLGITGTESKCLFAKTKSNRYFMLVTTQETRADWKALKQLTGESLSMCSGDELLSVTGYVPGCAGPFALPASVIVIADSKIFTLEKYVFSGGIPEITLVISGADLKKAIDIIPRHLIL